MTIWLRFADLRERNVAQSWTQLQRLIRLYGFPPGRMISPNTRAWTDDEVDAYYRSCPVEGPELRGAAKKKREEKRDREAATDDAGERLEPKPEPKAKRVNKPPRGQPRKAESETTDNVSMKASRPPD